ncbi:MAG: leucine-rich repeat domain-containing protein, partial [Ureaplasma sp.]|nr:leucine-rich repeat domain-containing protein [Ureaplasma sp.]
IIGIPNSILDQASSQLLLNNLLFYTQISIEDSDLIGIKNRINEYITNNSIASGNDISNEQLKQFLQNTKATVLADNTKQDLLSFISSISFKNNAVQIVLNNLIKIDDKEIADQNISIKNNIITINDFNFKPSRDFYIWNGNTITGLTDLGKQQTELILPSETTNLTDTSFKDCTNLVSVDMSLTSITTIPDGWFTSGTLNGWGTFSGCTNLETIKLPSTLKSIGMSAFLNCSKLNSINPTEITTNDGTTKTINTFNDNLTKIADRAFMNCSSLTQITFPESLTYLGAASFYATGLIDVVIPKQITVIKQALFEECRSLKTVKLEGNVTEIQNTAFRRCKALETINIPDSIQSIQALAFQYARSGFILEVSSEEMKEKLINTYSFLSNQGAVIVVKSSSTNPEMATPKLSQ